MSLTELTHWLPTTDRRVAHPALTLSRRGLVAIVVAAGVLAGANVQLSVSPQAAIYLFGMVALILPHGGYAPFANPRRRAGPDSLTGGRRGRTGRPETAARTCARGSTRAPRAGATPPP